eukprot:495863-Prymnesium_polylepis.1
MRQQRTTLAGLGGSTTLASWRPEAVPALVDRQRSSLARLQVVKLALRLAELQAPASRQRHASTAQVARWRYLFRPHAGAGSSALGNGGRAALAAARARRVSGVRSRRRVGRRVMTDGTR